MLPCCAGMGDTTGGSGGAPGGTGGPVAAGGAGMAAGVLSIVTKSGVITGPELYLRQSKTGVVWGSWRSLYSRGMLPSGKQSRQLSCYLSSKRQKERKCYIGCTCVTIVAIAPAGGGAPREV